jgi:hypothetical protein
MRILRFSVHIATQHSFAGLSSSSSHILAVLNATSSRRSSIAATSRLPATINGPVAFFVKTDDGEILGGLLGAI